MINQIKVYGERHSGTNFITALMKHNLKGVEILSLFYKHYSGWKHGYPKYESYNNHDNILFVFIVRDLKTWLTSMFKNPCFFNVPADIYKFAENPLRITDKRMDHDVHHDPREQESPLDIRSGKIQAYIDFLEKVPNGIIVNLEDLQQDKGEKFINYLHEKYGIKISSEFNPIMRHVKNGAPIQNRTYDVNLSDEWLLEHQDDDIEDFVNGLKLNYYHIK